MTVVHSTVIGFGETEFGSTEFGEGVRAGALGIQFNAQIVDSKNQLGAQFEASITSAEPTGKQFFASNMRFVCPGFGEVDFGGLPFGATGCLASLGFQFETIINDFASPTGLEFGGIVDGSNDLGIQWQAVITDVINATGAEFEAINTQVEATGLQFRGEIVDFKNNQGLQIQGQIVDVTNPQGIQFESVSVSPIGLEFRVNIYNTDQLRILCDFQNRGATSGAGTNAWGNTIATGETWFTNSQAAGDFDVQNLNTDIVEQVYRSTVITGLRLDCDSEQQVFLDTLAILNHNMTTSATITLIGSSVSNFATVDFSANLTAREDRIFYLADVLPTASYRYWRIEIDDVTNTDPFIEIGTIVFGGAAIFAGECMIDRVIKSTRHFADSTRTEGFTAVKNNRAIKDKVTLGFKSLDFNKGNFQTLDEIIKTARTSQKCLWIPTPDPDNPSFTERFAVFAKMAKMPQQVHNVKGANLDYIDLTIELDESE